MTEHNIHDDDALAGRLKDVVAQIDPVPEMVTEFALAAIDFRTLDAEIAELVYDSAADADQAALVRSGEGPRMLSFEAGELSIELEVTARGDRRDVMGFVIPPQIVDIVIRHREGVSPIHVSASGQFNAADLPSGPISLRVRGHGEHSQAIETEWLPL